MSVLRSTHWFLALMAIVLAMAVLTSASRRAHASGHHASLSEACHGQAQFDSDDNHHDGKQEPSEQSSCCAGICADFVSPAVFSVSAGQALSYAALPALELSAVRSLVPDSPHRPPRA